MMPQFLVRKETLMTKRMKIMTAGLIFVFIGIIAFNVLKGILIQNFFAHYSPPPVHVSSVTAVQKSWQPHLAAVGNFVALNGLEIHPETSGTVAQIHFESGQFLEQGSPLIDLNDEVEQATLKYNEAELTLRDLNYKRQIELQKRGAASSAAVDEARATLQQAQANVQRIQAEIKKKHILAPFSGQLGIRQVHLGQYLSPGQTPVVTLQSLDPIYLEFYLPEHYLNRLHLNQALKVSVEEYPGQQFLGKITAINSKIDPDTHNILIQATLANCPAESIQSKPIMPLLQCNSEENRVKQISQFAFVPGMFASIAIEEPAIPNVIVLPSTAISYSLYGDSVFIIHHEKDKTGKDILRTERVFVSTGAQDGNNTIITKGVQVGQEIVSSGELKLKNGTQVVINNRIRLTENEQSKPLNP